MYLLVIFFFLEYFRRLGLSVKILCKATLFPCEVSARDPEALGPDDEDIFSVVAK